jgi:hypothetical protein
MPTSFANIPDIILALALYGLTAMAHAVLFLVGLVAVNRALANRRDEKAEKEIAAMPDHIFIEAIRLYDGQ